MTETVVSAAILVVVPKALMEELEGYPDQLIISAPPPARHHTLLHLFYVRFGQTINGTPNQGFITSTGRFVSREEAYDVASLAGQKFVDHPSKIEGKLFSEDLW